MAEAQGNPAEVVVSQQEESYLFMALITIDDTEFQYFDYFRDREMALATFLRRKPANALLDLRECKSGIVGVNGFYPYKCSEFLGLREEYLFLYAYKTEGKKYHAVDYFRNAREACRCFVDTIPHVKAISLTICPRGKWVKLGNETFFFPATKSEYQRQKRASLVPNPFLNVF